MKAIINRFIFLVGFFSDVEMLQSKPDTSVAGDEVSITTKDSMLRKFLEGETYFEGRMAVAQLKQLNRT